MGTEFSDYCTKPCRATSKPNVNQLECHYEQEHVHDDINGDEGYLQKVLELRACGSQNTIFRKTLGSSP
jgi:hypothetical protein